MGFNYESKEIEKIRLNWSKFFKLRSGFINGKWTSEIVLHYNQHIDDHTNCGAYVCYFFEKLLKKNFDKLFTIDQGTIESYRTKIKKTIF